MLLAWLGTGDMHPLMEVLTVIVLVVVVTAPFIIGGIVIIAILQFLYRKYKKNK